MITMRFFATVGLLLSAFASVMACGGNSVEAQHADSGNGGDAITGEEGGGIGCPMHSDGTCSTGCCPVLAAHLDSSNACLAPAGVVNGTEPWGAYACAPARSDGSCGGKMAIGCVVAHHDGQEEVLATSYTWDNGELGPDYAPCSSEQAASISVQLCP